MQKRHSPNKNFRDTKALKIARGYLMPSQHRLYRIL